MLNTNGGRFGGYGFYLLKGKPVFTWNLLGLKRVRWEGPEALTTGKHTLEFDFKYDGLGFATLSFNDLSGIGRSGTGLLKVDGKKVATQKMERTIPIILQWAITLLMPQQDTSNSKRWLAVSRGPRPGKKPCRAAPLSDTTSHPEIFSRSTLPQPSSDVEPTRSFKQSGLIIGREQFGSVLLYRRTLSALMPRRLR